MRVIYIITAVVLILSCATTRNVPENTDLQDNVPDSTEYEMIVMDPGFESWFAVNSKPDWYHSQTYYENWNRQYTHAWNSKINTFPHGHLLSTSVNYEDNIDYGLEINHKLFYYFKYVERVLRIPILKNGPRHVIGF
jgi:hypothetical protein